MSLSEYTSLAKTYALPLLAFALFFSLLRNKYNGLSKIPGPKLAAYTKFWRLYDVYQGQAHLTAIKLHKKHGSLVRIAPNVISVADPKEISKIYNIKGDFTKTAFYPIQSISWKKQPQMNLFSTRDENEHREQRRKIAHTFSLEALLKMEPAIDDCSALLISKLGDFSDRNEPVDLGSWLQYYGLYTVILCHEQHANMLQPSMSSVS